MGKRKWEKGKEERKKVERIEQEGEERQEERHQYCHFILIHHVSSETHLKCIKQCKLVHMSLIVGRYMHMHTQWIEPTETVEL